MTKKMTAVSAKGDYGLKKQHVQNLKVGMQFSYILIIVKR